MTATCHCITHPGLTHAEDMDLLDYGWAVEALERLAEDPGWPRVWGLAVIEQRRLAEKARQMEQGETFDSPAYLARRAPLRAREQAAWARLRETA